MNEQLSDERLTELRGVAESSTPGPWTAETWDVIRNWRKTGYREGIVRDPGGISITCDDGVYGVLVASDAEYIAEFDPPTCLALLDELTAYRRREAGSATQYGYQEPDYGTVWVPCETVDEADQYRQPDDVLVHRLVGAWEAVGDDD